MLKLSMLFTDCSNKDSGTDNTTIESLTDTVSIDDNNPNDNLTLFVMLTQKTAEISDILLLPKTWS